MSAYGDRRYGDEAGPSDGSRWEPEPVSGHDAWTPAATDWQPEEPTPRLPLPSDGEAPRRPEWLPSGRKVPGSPGRLPSSRRVLRAQGRLPTGREVPWRPEQSRPQVRAMVLAVLLLVVVPMLGAVVSGSRLGVVFALSCGVAALGAAVLSTSRGLWWIVPSTPTALLAVAFLWVVFDGLSGAKSTVAAATSVFDGIAGAFPGIAAGTAAALAVAGWRAVQGRIEGKAKRG